MAATELSFNRDAIRPAECWSEGWALVKERYWLFVGMTAVAMLIGAVAPMGILMGAMSCGVMIALLTALRGEEVEFGLVFKGFDYFLPSLLVTLLKMAFAMAIVIPAYIGVFLLIFVAAAAGGAGKGGEAVGLAVMLIGGLLFFLVIVTLSLALGALLAFAYPLIVDRKLEAWDACRTSARAARANLGGLVGLILLCGLAGFAGVLLCYVGLFLVLPINYAAMTVAYRRVFPDQGAAFTTVASPPARTNG